MITVAIYDAANAVLVTELEDSHSRSWQDRISDPGGGAFSLQNDDADRAACAFGRVVRYSIDGVPRFAALIESKTIRGVAPGEEADQLSDYKGRGTMARWEDFVVYPEGGTSRPNDTRTFNFASSYFDDAGWGFAVQDEQGTGDAGGPRYGFPTNLPPEAEPAWWIWSQAKNGAGSMPAGDAYFRKTYNSPGELVRIFITADNAHELWLDNALLEVDSVTMAGGVGWAGLKSIDRWLSPGNHLFAIKATNLPGVDPNPGGVLMAAVKLVEQGSQLGATVLVTDSSWKALGYPAAPPGFTPRRVLEILLTEAQTRGAVPGLTIGGTNAVDSDGVAWPVSPDISVRVGTDGLSVLRQLSEAYIDCAMDPASLRLDVWVHGGKGGASGVVFAAGVNIVEAVHDVTKPDVTATLDRWAGGWHESSNAGLVAAHGRLEGFFSNGDAPSTEEATRAAEKIIARLGAPSERITLAIEPAGSDFPFLHFVTGDGVTAPNSEGVVSAWRTRGITVTEDPEGNPIYVPEIETP